MLILSTDIMIYIDKQIILGFEWNYVETYFYFTMATLGIIPNHVMG